MYETSCRQGVFSLAKTSGKWECVPGACSNETNAVQVTTRRTATVNGPVNIFFGQVLGKDTQELTARATAFRGWPKELPGGFGFPLAIGYQYVPKIVGERRPVTFSPDWGDSGGWHCFEEVSADANKLKRYIDGSLGTPGIEIGDFISCLNGVANSVVINSADSTLKSYQARGEPWIVYLPVIDATKMNQNREVLGFCAFEIENVDKKNKAISGDALGMYTSPPGGSISPTNPNPNNSLKSTKPVLVQ